MSEASDSVGLQRGRNGDKKLGGITGKGFMPGRSGNPTGKRKHTPSLRAALKRTTTRSDCEKVARRLVALAKQGDAKATRLLAELLGDLHGTAVTVGIHEEAGSGPIRICWPHETLRAEVEENGRAEEPQIEHEPGQAVTDVRRWGKERMVAR
jgi:hypothetical protein